ncbi:MAG: hypothetical protein LAO03_09630 [Acidobacteriia bacterium]|nr:hypothetical protein [Terriglobia bacterium]
MGHPELVWATRQIPEALAKQTDFQRRHSRARSSWDESSQPAWLTPELFSQKIQLLLSNVATSVIRSSIGVSRVTDLVASQGLYCGESQCQNPVMSVDLHPDACKRFDEVATEILRQVQTRHPKSSSKATYIPDIQPKAQIKQGDIIGPITNTTSIVDGRGVEVGRFIERDGYRVGLEGSAFEQLKKLASRLQECSVLRDVISETFSLDAVFEWLIGRHQGGDSTELSKCFLEKVNSALIDATIWIPLYRVHLQSDITLGQVTFKTITREFIDKWQAAAMSKSPDHRNSLQQFFDQERARLQGACAAVVTIAGAEKARAVEIAREKALTATSLLRFLSMANRSPRLQSFCTLLGREAVYINSELIFVGQGNIPQYVRSAEYSKQTAWIIDNNYISQMREVIRSLSTLATQENQTPFKKTLLDALLLYSRNSVASDPADKLVYVMVALESVFLRNENEPIQKSVAERMAFVVGDSQAKRKAIASNFAQTYSLRSSFVHHGNSIADLDVLEEFLVNAWSCFIGVLGTIERYRTKEELINALEDRKFA